ncbi:MAG: hypothetical protein G01um101416_323 [Microgenomates group bacterium Gr01-1014_16]|nr:MAG: hypothetical protein G01um101416_323 [Microgenomates group bacterium Gr01-1014_16]
MAKRRTRQEKIIARLKKEIRPSYAKATEGEKVAEVKPNIIMDEESLPKVELKADLTRTAIVAILALVLQAGMYYLLNYRNGWEIISKFWERG